MITKNIIRRKLRLKQRAAAKVRAEIQDLHFQQMAMRYRNQLAGRIQGDKFDSKLSALLDAVQGLLDGKV